MEVAAHWIEQGIDGWRLDVPTRSTTTRFWQEFRRRVQGANPEAYIVGEIWTEAQRWLQGDQFDAVMNYLLGSACLGFFVEGGPDAASSTGTGYAPHASRWTPPASPGPSTTCWRSTRPPSPSASSTCIGSHDTARLLTMARNDESAVRLACSS